MCDHDGLVSVQTLVTYYLADLKSTPLVDPLLLALLSVTTEKLCNKQRKKKVEIIVAGKKTKVRAQDVMMVAWSHLIEAMTKTAVCSPAGTENSNCSLLSRYVAWKTLVTQQLFKGRGDVSQERATPAEGVLGDDRAFSKLAKKVQRQAVEDFLFGKFSVGRQVRVRGRIRTARGFPSTCFCCHCHSCHCAGDSIRHQPFGRLIDFLGKWKWLRVLVLKLARRLVEKMFPAADLKRPVDKKRRQQALLPAQQFGLALYYGMKKEAEVLTASGRKGAAKIVGQLVRSAVRDMFRQKPKGSQVSSGKMVSSSFLNAFSDPGASTTQAPLREGAGKTRPQHKTVIAGSPNQALIGPISLVESNWTKGEKRAVTGIVGLVVFFIGLSGLPGPLLFPILFMVVGLAMCLGAVVASLMDMNLFSGFGRARGEKAGLLEEEEAEEEGTEEKPQAYDAKASASEEEQERWGSEDFS